jgi:hypothetical protein
VKIAVSIVFARKTALRNNIQLIKRLFSKPKKQFVVESRCGSNCDLVLKFMYGIRSPLYDTFELLYYNKCKCEDVKSVAPFQAF